MHAKLERVRPFQTEQEICALLMSAQTAQYLVITGSAILKKVVKSVLSYFITVMVRLTCLAGRFYGNQSRISNKKYSETMMHALSPCKCLVENNINFI